MRLRFFFLMFVFSAFIHAAEKKPLPVSIRLHGEGNEKEGESFVMPIDLANPSRRIFVRKIPIISERDIKAFYPFPGYDGMAGAYFRLDAHGTNKLQQFTVEDRGKLAVILVNGRTATAVRVEKEVSDGIFFVPGGILPQEILQLEQRYPVIGRESEFRKKPPRPKKEPVAKAKKSAS